MKKVRNTHLVWGLVMLIAIACAGGATASAQMLEHRFAIVTTSDPAMVVPLYKEQDMHADISYSYYQGTLVKVQGESSSGWQKVVIAGVKGYMPSEYLQFVDFAEMETRLPVMNIKNKTESGALNLREKPSFESQIIRQYYNGEEVLVMGISDEWYHVIGYGGRVGYMKPEFLEAGGTTGLYMFSEDLLQLRPRPN